MNGFDDIFDKAPVRQEQENQPFDKNAWSEKKKADRQAVYDLADTTAQIVGGDSKRFQSYLDMQIRFARYSTTNVLLILAQKPDATHRQVPACFKESKPQEIRAVLSEIRDIAANISGRMNHVLEQERRSKSREQER